MYNSKQKSFSIDEIGWIKFLGKPKEAEDKEFS